MTSDENTVAGDSQVNGGRSGSAGTGRADLGGKGRLTRVKRDLRRPSRLTAIMLGLSLIAWLVVALSSGGTGPAEPPLPGLDPHAAVLAANARVYTYRDSAATLSAIQPGSAMLTAGYLSGIADHSRYAPGTVDHMLAYWKQYQRAGGTWGWVAYRSQYVNVLDNWARNEAFGEYFRRQEGLSTRDGWMFEVKVPGTTPRLIADAVNEGLHRIYEFRSGSGVRADELAAPVAAANEAGMQVVYVFGAKPSATALQLIQNANRAVTANKKLIAARQKPHPMIVARYWPALAQQVSAGPGSAAGGTAAQVLAAPGQQPIAGALTDAIASSPDSPQAATEMARLDALLAGDFGEDALPDPGNLHGIDFSTLELRYVSDTYAGGSGLRFAFRATRLPAGQPSYGGMQAAQLASDSFFTFLELPVSTFVVNLNPDQPNQVIDPRLARTDAGRVLLESDLRLKQVIGQLIRPDTPLGKRYWHALAGPGKCRSSRVWIVPAPATVHASGGQLYILNAPLQVKSVTQYVQTRTFATAACQGQDQATRQHNEAVFRTMILPLAAQLVNTAPEFADLRRVYVSRVAAQWYRTRSATTPTAYAGLIDHGDIGLWTARQPWSPQAVYSQYRREVIQGQWKFSYKSLQSGPKRTFNVTFGGINWKISVESPRGEITHTLIYGGIDFNHITYHNISDASFNTTWPTLPATVNTALSGAADSQGGREVWLGGGTTGGMNMALGLDQSGSLAKFASEVGGQTFNAWQGNDFQANFLKNLNDPNNRVSFDLTGIDNPYAAVTRVARNGGAIGGEAGYTDWELYQIYMNRDTWSRITWYNKGGVVDNPFGP